MERSKGWFVALYGSVFGSLFGIIFMLMVLFRNFNLPQPPDWNTFIQGYGDALASDGYTAFSNGLRDAFQFVQTQALNVISFGRFGQEGWWYWIIGGFNLFNGFIACLFIPLVVLVIGGFYVLSLILPLLSSVTFILGGVFPEGVLPGGALPNSYWSEVGFDVIYSCSDGWCSVPFSEWSY